MQSETYTLKNGLKVVLVDTQAFPSLTTLLFVGAGSRYENEKNNGIAHFFEHMAFKGSKKYPSAQILAEIVEGQGGIFNAFTSDDHTGYYVKSPAEDAGTIVDVIGDMIQHPLLKEEELQKEKGVIVQEINMYEDLPQRRVYELFENLLYPTNPLGYDIIGTKENVTSFTKKTFSDYMSELYHPNNAVLTLAGGLTAKSLNRDLSYYKDVIEKRFSAWKQKDTIPGITEVEESQNEPALLVKHKKSEQAHMCFGYRSIKRTDKKKYALGILTSVLGSGMSSRLFREVREKRGLCYSVRTYTESYDDVGYVVTYAGVEPNIDKATEALKVIKEQHGLIVDKGITEEELVRAKQMISGHMILALEDTFNVASAFGKKMLFENKVLKVQDVLDQYEKVTLNDIKAIAEEVFTQSTSNLAVIGPFKDETPFKNILE